MRRPRKIPDAATLFALRARVLGAFWDGEPVKRLERAITWLRSSAMPAPDRRYVIERLERELDRELALLRSVRGRKALQARMASELAAKGGISRELGALLVAGNDKEAAAIFDRVRRLRKNRGH